MIITGHINFFSIEECGLYKIGGENPVGLGLKETLDIVSEWISGRAKMADTLPWDPENSKKGISKCYCKDLYKDKATGDYIFVLWKSDGAGQILGAPEDSPAGKGDVIEYGSDHKGKKIIWGHPCYYWFITELNMVASIKFDHSVCDSLMMQEWFSKTITNKVKHNEKIRTMTTESGLIRFSFDEKAGEVDSGTKLLYKFSAKIKSFDSASAELTALASKISKIVKRETIRLNSQADERARWLKLFDNFADYISPGNVSKSRRIEIRADIKPTAEEVKKIVEDFSVENRGGDWDNVGFEMEDGRLFWVDKYRLHDTVKVNVNGVYVIKAVELYSRLENIRDRIIEKINASMKENDVNRISATS